MPVTYNKVSLISFPPTKLASIRIALKSTYIVFVLMNVINHPKFDNNSVEDMYLLLEARRWNCVLEETVGQSKIGTTIIKEEKILRVTDRNRTCFKALS